MECWRSNVRYPMRDPETGRKFDRYRRPSAESEWVEGITTTGEALSKVLTMEFVRHNLNGGYLVACADEMAKEPYEFLIKDSAAGTAAPQKKQQAAGTAAIRGEAKAVNDNVEKPAATTLPCPPSELTLQMVDKGKALTHVNEELGRAARAGGDVPGQEKISFPKGE